MTKEDLIDAIRRRMGWDVKQAEQAFNAVIGEIKTTLSKGEEVHLRRFGKFKLNHKKARTGRNPKTGAPALIKARTTTTFKPGSILRNISHV